MIYLYVYSEHPCKLTEASSLAFTQTHIHSFKSLQIRHLSRLM